MYWGFSREDFGKYFDARCERIKAFRLRANESTHAKEIIFQLDDIDGVYRTETMISLEESINDKKRLMHSIFNEL